MEKYKIMRMLCMFDLPVETEEQRRFIMMQYSIYVRVCPSREYAKRLENRIKKNLPQEGNVRLLCVTEKQYSDMKLLVGSRQTAETAIGVERLIII